MQKASGCRWLWLSRPHTLWNREFARLAALPWQSSSMGLPRTLSKGTSGLAVGRPEAVSCCMVLLRSLVSQSVAISWRVAVMKALALSPGVSRKSQRRRAVVALGGVSARHGVNPGQEENRRLHCVQNCHCLLSAGSALGADFFLTSAQRGHCNPSEGFTTTEALITSST